MNGPTAKQTVEPTLEQLVRKLAREEVQAELARTNVAAERPTTYVSVSEYARARSISISTVRNAIRDGRLPAMKVGAAVRIRAEQEIGRPVMPRAPAPTASQIAERIIAKQHKRRRFTVV